MPNEIYHKSHWGNANAEGFGDVYFDAAATNKLYNHSDYYENSWGTDKILRDLSNKASIVLTPTAYSNGSLNTVIPPYQALTTELVTNGSFDTDSDWSKDAGWTISNGTAICNGLGINSLQQSGITTVGKVYKLTFDVLDSNNFDFVVISTNFGDTYVDADLNNAVVLGKNTFYIKPTNGTGIRFRVSNGTTLSIDNVSVKEVQEADFDFSRGSSATRVNEKGLIESIASGLPRIDYTSGFGSLLLEPSRTNSVTKSENIQDWNFASNASGEYGYEDPFKGNKAVKLTSTSDAQAYQAYQGSSVLSSGTTYTYSIYAKRGTGYNFLIDFAIPNNGSVIVDLRDGSLISESGVGYIGYNVDALSNGWYRISMVSTFNSSLYFRTGLYNQQGDCYVAFSQIEAGSYATSYIPTSGSTVTRSADVANNSGNADLFNDSEGVLFTEVAALANDGTTREMALSDGGISNRIEIRYFSSNNAIQTVIRGAASTIVLSYTLTDATEFAKVAVKYKSGDYALWVNGVEVATSTTTGTPTGFSEFAFDDGNGNFNIYGRCKTVSVFKEALTDAELQQLTS